ncbi:hypothetical protein GEMRC1_009201 [Eukaryota sp. GEM-RC1]
MEGHSIEACRDPACRTSKVNKRRAYQNPRNPRPTSDNTRSITRSKSNTMFTKTFKDSFAEDKYHQSRDFKSKAYSLETTLSAPDEYPDDEHDLTLPKFFQDAYLDSHTNSETYLSYSSPNDYTYKHSIPLKPLSISSEQPVVTNYKVSPSADDDPTVPQRKTPDTVNDSSLRGGTFLENYEIVKNGFFERKARL